jgi:hypothetical protein
MAGKAACFSFSVAMQHCCGPHSMATSAAIQLPHAAMHIRRLVPADAAAYRELMLVAYARHPDAFTSTAEERAVLDQARARPGVRLVQLMVTDGNEAAQSLYAACGFVPFGIEPLAVSVGDRFVAKMHTWCDLDARA